MKTLFRLLLFAVMLCLWCGAVCFGAEAVIPAVESSVAPVNAFTSAIAWMQGNQVIVGIFIAAILDFIFAINPEWKSNGALHFIYTLVTRGKTPAA